LAILDMRFQTEACLAFTRRRIFESCCKFRTFPERAVQRRACPFDDGKIIQLFPSADIVGLAHAAVRQDKFDSPAMIFDVKPIASIPAVAIDRERLSEQRIDNEKRNEL